MRERQTEKRRGRRRERERQRKGGGEGEREKQREREGEVWEKEPRTEGAFSNLISNGWPSLLKPSMGHTDQP